MLEKVLIILLVSGALLVSVAGCGKDGEKREEATAPGNAASVEPPDAHCGLPAGMKAPTFSLPDVKGNKVDLGAMVGKDTLIVVFWGTWCPYCRMEALELKQIQNTYRQKGLQVVSIAVMDTAETVGAFAKKEGINYTVLLDGKNEAAALYHIQAVPTLFVVDRNGVIRHCGHRAQGVEAKIKALLEA